MKIGFATQLWLRDNHFENFHRMLDEMSLIGFDGFEMAPAYLIEQYEGRAAELRRLLDMHELELSSYYLGMTYDIPEERERGIAEFKRRCRFVAELGFENVLLDGGRKRPNTTPQQLDDHIKIVAETANMLGEYARSLGLTLSWHQHWGSIFEVQAPFHRLMELTDPTLVGFCPDVGQLTLGDFDVVETVRRYVDRIRYVHYKDVTCAGRPQGELWPGGPVVPSDDGAYGIDSRWRWVELGRGVVDFPAITEVLLEAGYDGWIVDDFDFTGYPARASAQSCKDYINQALNIWGERDIRRGLAPAQS
ncbi:MAG TPA: TIM barrel protein [Chloroflexi bacterium]|jgi:inosose dehydratase|nr:TIM barrel protein [Chloroflexota bacterium]